MEPADYDTPPHQTNPRNVVGAVVAVIVALAGGFAGGMQFQKAHTPQVANAAALQRHQGAGPHGHQMMAFGVVAAISTTSITVYDEGHSAARTFTINGATKILNGTAPAAVSDIKTGDQAIVQPTTPTTPRNPDPGSPKLASRIIINPSNN